ncbi:DNA-directed RNA polymerase, RBP11-like dimerization domain containing protein [Nitzschia inconspicua]|uniref:DNA-directed RNA polymerase, RBP11-like dimerization domain containing protein n=1 Tax=Nitzschia inconspicua TaxID=303405 RepID=A0A9K3LUN3_9STRA|nr:DNA-directed RNA polymerase, RBP11-like dimerization domain containing protein [Nitzschia inconspicua]
MSVNEVKLTKAVPFTIRGTGPPSSRTFAIGNEDHTIGNALRHILLQNSKVEFAGYSVPHPAEPVVHLRVQTHEPTTALQALQESCETLFNQCEIVLSKIEEKLPEIKDDRLQLEAKLQEMQEDGGELGDEDDAMEED